MRILTIGSLNALARSRHGVHSSLLTKAASMQKPRGLRSRNCFRLQKASQLGAAHVSNDALSDAKAASEAGPPTHSPDKEVAAATDAESPDKAPSARAAAEVPNRRFPSGRARCRRIASLSPIPKSQTLTPDEICKRVWGILDSAAERRTPRKPAAALLKDGCEKMQTSSCWPGRKPGDLRGLSSVGAPDARPQQRRRAEVPASADPPTAVRDRPRLQATPPPQGFGSLHLRVPCFSGAAATGVAGSLRRAPRATSCSQYRRSTRNRGLER